VGEANNPSVEEQLSEKVTRLSRLLQQELVIPISIFASPLSPAEALVKYLKEHKNLRLAEIARLLNRDQRGIWCTHKRAQTKMPAVLAITAASPTVHASVFCERKLSILEHVVHHLRSQNIAVKDIAQLINKHPSTIASVHHRVRRKLR